MASNDLSIDVRIGFTVPDTVAERCLAVVRMWLEDHPDMTVRIERDGDRVTDVSFWRMDKGAHKPKEPARCKYFHTEGGGRDFCWGQKYAPACLCGGDTAKCEILPKPDVE